MSQAIVLRFPDRRSAYGFVSEIRRLYDLDRWVSLRVQRLDDDVLVELPAAGYSTDVAAIAVRHGGSEPATTTEGDRLRAALARAHETERLARRSVERARRTNAPADEAIGPAPGREGRDAPQSD